MADKWQDLAGRLKNAGGGGAPRGLGLGIKLLAGGIAAAYGLQQSMYTGQAGPCHALIMIYFNHNR